MVKEAKAFMTKLHPLLGIANSVVDLEFFQDPEYAEIVEKAHMVQVCKTQQFTVAQSSSRIWS